MRKTEKYIKEHGLKNRSLKTERRRLKDRERERERKREGKLGEES